MAKRIVPIKMIVDFKKDGTYKDAILLYKTKLRSGMLSRKIYTISVNAKVSKPIMNSLLREARIFAKTQENKRKVIREEDYE